MPWFKISFPLIVETRGRQGKPRTALSDRFRFAGSFPGFFHPDLNGKEGQVLQLVPKAGFRHVADHGDAGAPGCWVVLGGEVLRGDREGEEDYIIVAKSPEQVRRVDQFLQGLTEAAFRKLYFAIDPVAYGFDLSEDDFDYTWSNLADSRPFWHSAAEKGLWVLFDVDQ